MKRYRGFAAAHGGQAAPERDVLQITARLCLAAEAEPLLRKEERAGKPEAFRYVLRRSREEQKAVGRRQWAERRADAGVKTTR